MESRRNGPQLSSRHDDDDDDNDELVSVGATLLHHVTKKWDTKFK